MLAARISRITSPAILFFNLKDFSRVPSWGRGGSDAGIHFSVISGLSGSQDKLQGLQITGGSSLSVVVLGLI